MANTVYTAAELAQMLHGILHATDNNERRAIEATVVRSVSQPTNLTLLVHILCNHSGLETSAGVRQLAAVLLRKKIFSLWNSLDQDAKQELRQLLLTQLGNEPVKLVRFAMAHIVARLAKADALRGGGGWPELQQAVRVAAEDPRNEMRELAMVLVYSVAEVFAEENSLSGLAAEAVVRGVADRDLTVQTAAVKAASMLLPCVENNAAVRAAYIAHLVPQCLQVLTGHCRDDARRSLCVSVLDLITQLMGELSAKKNASLLSSMASQLLLILGDRTTLPSVRQSCSAALGELVSMKPKFIVSQNMLQPLVECCVQLMSEDATISLPDTTDLDVEDDDGEDDDADMLRVNSPCMMGGHLLSTIATTVSSKAFTATLLQLLTPVTNELDAADPLTKKACVVALACLAEGNPSYLRRKVGYMLSITRRLFEDANPVPREAAAFALSYFCLHLQPEILAHHGELFPMLVPLLADDNDLVRRRVGEALDTLCENVAENLEPYIPVVLPAVVNAIGRSSLETQKALCGVISSMAMTRCESFTPFAPSILDLLRQSLELNTPETMALRAQATETVGVVGAAMGKEAFMPFTHFFMGKVVENLQLGSAALREHSFGFLANLCEVLGTDFLPYVADSIAAAMRTIEEDRASYTNQHLLAKAEMSLALGDELDDAGKAAAKDGREASDTDSEEDDGDTAEEIHMRVRTADVEEKSSALYCLGTFAEVLRGALSPAHVEQCWESLMTMEGHFHPNIRSNAMVAAAKVLTASHGSPVVEKSLTADTLQEPTRGMLDDFIHQVLLTTIHRDTEKAVVAAACEAMTILLKFFGSQCFQPLPDALVQEVIGVLRHKKACQLATDFDAEDSDQEDVDGEDALFREAAATADPSLPHGSWRDVVTPQMVLQDVQLPEDHDDEVLEAAAEMLEELAASYGAAFAVYLPYLLPLLALYADPQSRPSEDIVTATGSMALVLQAVGGPAVGLYFDSCIAVSFAVIKEVDDSTARANSCFLLRVLVENCPDRFTAAQTTEQTLHALWAVVSSSDEIPEAVDNAISATCSLVRCVPPDAIPLDSVVPSMLRGIPMRLDKAENKNAISTLVYLLTTRADTTASSAWLVDLVSTVANVFASRAVEESDKIMLLQEGLLPFARGTSQAAWLQAKQSAALSPEQLSALRQAGC